MLWIPSPWKITKIGDSTHLSPPDYRSGHRQTEMTTTNVMNNQDLTSYRNSAEKSIGYNRQRAPTNHSKEPISNSSLPKKSEAVIVNVVGDTLKLVDYVRAVSQIVGPQNIKYASKVANSRICIFLSSETLVTQLVNSHETIKVGEVEVGIRRLITPSKRLIISNAFPAIPDDLIANTLKSMGLKLLSRVSALRAGLHDDDLSHILSFRRQVYMTPTESDVPLNGSVIIKHDNTNYRLYLSYDDMRCFLCKQEGHIAANCSNVLDPTSKTHSTPAIVPDEKSASTPSKDPNSASATSGPSEAVMDKPDQEDMRDRTPSAGLTTAVTFKASSSFTTRAGSPVDIIIHRENTDSEHLPLPGSKRPAPPSESTEALSNLASPTDEATNQDDFILPVKSQEITKSKPARQVKKTRLSKSKSLEDLSLDKSLSVVKSVIKDNPSQYILSYPQFKSFIENLSGSDNPMAEARRFTTDIPALLQMMYELYPLISDRSIKSRFTRFRTKAKKQLQLEGIEVGSLDNVSMQDSNEGNPQLSRQTSLESVDTSY